MTALIGAAVGRLRFNHAPMALEQQAEVESARGVAELIGPAISRLGLGQRPLLFEQSAEVRGGGPTVTFIGVTIGRIRFNHAPLAGSGWPRLKASAVLAGLGGSSVWPRDGQLFAPLLMPAALALA